MLLNAPLLTLLLLLLEIFSSKCQKLSGRPAGIRREGRHPDSSLAQDQAEKADGKKTAKLKQSYPFYHSSKELKNELVRLARPGGCPGATFTMRTVNDSDVSIDMVNVKGASVTSPVNKVFLVAGEHARELIGPETTLYFLRALCGDGDAKFGQTFADTSVALLEDSAADQYRATVLESSEFGIVINANPMSRKRVEKGNYCLRANANEVDLNRNWDTHWAKQADPEKGIGGAGTTAFSEPETRLVRDLVQEFKPTTFLSIHSGTRGMYMPWAYSQDSLASSNQASMMSVLTSIDKKHCQCPYGAAGKEVGYPCAGTSVDWAYDKLKTPYSFAFEIFGGNDDDLKRRWEQKVQQKGSVLLQNDMSIVPNLVDPYFRDFFTDFPSDFVGVTSSVAPASLLQTGTTQTEAQCLQNFNPTTQTSYDQAIANWASAFADMSVKIAGKLATTKSVQVIRKSKSHSQKSKGA